MTHVNVKFTFNFEFSFFIWFVTIATDDIFLNIINIMYDVMMSTYMFICNSNSFELR